MSFFLVILLGMVAHAQPTYRVQDIGILLSDSWIGQTGVVAGTSSRAYAWDIEHGVTAIPGIQGVYGAFLANSVNARGEVVGMDFVRLNNVSFDTAYIWDRVNGTREVASFPRTPWGPARSHATGINDLGQVVGYYQGKDSKMNRSFVAVPGQGWQELPRYRLEQGVDARHINNAGQIVGYSHGDVPQGTPIMWQPDGSIIELGNLPIQRQNFVNDLNDLGAIAGESSGNLGVVGYYRDKGGAYSRIWNPFNAEYTRAFGLNNHGIVVGDLWDGESAQGFYWTSQTGAIGLNSLLDPSSSGWDIWSAFGVNDAGQITAIAFNSYGQGTCVVLNPVPEPASVVTVALGILAVLQKRYKVRQAEVFTKLPNG